MTVSSGKEPGRPYSRALLCVWRSKAERGELTVTWLCCLQRSADEKAVIMVSGRRDCISQHEEGIESLRLPTGGIRRVVEKALALVTA